jgi:hypothetical protein
MAGKIFINYRRGESASEALNVAQYFERTFGKSNVFIDIDHLRAGQPFPAMLENKLDQCKVMLAIIGPNWVDTCDESGSRRLNNPEDWVRLEIERSLARKIPVIPVLVAGATLPSKRDLPPTLQPLVEHQCATVTTDGFRHEMAGLARDVANLTGRTWSWTAAAASVLILVGSAAAYQFGPPVWWPPFNPGQPNVEVPKPAAKPEADAAAKRNADAVEIKRPAEAAGDPAHSVEPGSGKSIHVGSQELNKTTPPPPNVKNGQEIEPNDNFMQANEIPLNTTISGAIESASDVDVFTFTMTGRLRDIVDVVLKNESSTLKPELTIYNSDKSQMSQRYNTTAGGDITMAFVAQPDSRYYIRVAPVLSNSGKYALMVRPRSAFDKYEPNDDILHAASVLIGGTIEAGIMDQGDVDYYTFETKNDVRLVVSFENRSATLKPELSIYNPDKSQMSGRANTTAGGDVTVAFVAQPGSRYYVRVAPYAVDGGSGKYALMVRPQ